MTDHADSRRVCRGRRMRAGMAVALVLALGAATGAEELGPYYLELGKQDFRAKRYIDAVHDFRIARFMTLSDPARHLEALARLALAEDSAGFKTERDASLERFFE